MRERRRVEDRSSRESRRTSGGYVGCGALQERGDGTERDSLQRRVDARCK